MSIEQSHPVIRDLIYGAVTGGSAAIVMAEELETEIRTLVRRGNFRGGKTKVYPRVGVLTHLEGTPSPIYAVVQPGGNPLDKIPPMAPDTRFSYQEFSCPIHGTDDSFRWYAVHYKKVAYFGMCDPIDMLRWGDAVEKLKYLRKYPEDDMIYVQHGFFHDPSEAIFKSTPGVAIHKP